MHKGSYKSKAGKSVPPSKRGTQAAHKMPNGSMMKGKMTPAMKKMMKTGK